MKAKRFFRTISIIAAFATVPVATEALATPLKAGGCTGGVFTSGGTPEILINRPPLYGICNPSA